MTPFIHLISSPFEHYVYDVNTNTLLSISEALFSFLKALPEESDIAWSTSAVQNEIEKLNSNGYLSSHRPKVIQHSLTPYLDTILARKMEKITLQLTQNCNFRCKYCIYSEKSTTSQRTHNNKQMNQEIAFKALDFFREHSVDSSTVTIGFYGGEPLLAFKLLKECVIYAQNIFEGKKVHFNLTSNISLLNDEMIDFFEKNDISLLVSLDGPKEIHDRNRVFAKDGSGTFDTVMGKFQYIQKNYPQFAEKISVNMVVDPTLEHPFSQLEEFVHKNLTHHYVSMSEIDDTYLDTKSVASDTYVLEKEYQYFLGYLLALGRINSSLVSSLIKMKIAREIVQIEEYLTPTKTLDTISPSGPCVPGAMRPMIDIYGNIFPCERISETCFETNLGNIQNGFDLKKCYDVLNIATTTADACKNCWGFRFCTQCIKTSIDDDGKISANNRLKNCAGNKFFAKKLLKTSIMYKELLSKFPDHIPVDAPKMEDYYEPQL